MSWRYIIPLLALASTPSLAAPAPAIEIVTAIEAHQVSQNQYIVVDEQGSIVSTAANKTITQVYISMQPQTVTTTATVSTNVTATSISTATVFTASPSPSPSPSPAVVAAAAAAAKPSAAAPVVKAVSQPAPSTNTNGNSGSSSWSSSGSGSQGGWSSSSSSSGSSSYTSSGPSDLSSCNTAAQPDQCRSALGQHNMYRARHAAQPMVWDENLASIARGKMGSAPCDMRDYIQLDPNGYQSNAAMGQSSLSAATDSWMSELGLFSSLGGFSLTQDELSSALAGWNAAHSKTEEVGHMVNVIFKSHTKLGCAQKMDCGGTYGSNFLCLYAPYALNHDDFRTHLSPA